MTEKAQAWSDSILSLDGWLEFNRYKWDVNPLKVRLNEDGKELPAVKVVLYLDRRGRIVQPPLNPYLPATFYPTPTDKPSRLYRQWESTGKLLMEEFVKRGIKGTVALPPEVVDIRQWQWRGFLGEVRYTFYLDLPYELNIADYSERKQVNKAHKAGFTCEIATKDMFTEVISCLSETEARQKFTYRLSIKDLQVAIDLLREETFRIYVCKSSSGRVACARITISIPGKRAIDWVAGTKREFLNYGCTQFLIWHVLKDLAQQGATGFDFNGANLPKISAAKADWGGKLVPYYVVRPLNLRTLGLLGLRILQQKKERS